jgi:hypothetical protein
MDPDRWPLDGLSPALVEKLVREMEASTDEQRDVLLADLLCAAWGSLAAQNQ